MEKLNMVKNHSKRVIKNATFELKNDMMRGIVKITMLVSIRLVHFSFTSDQKGINDIVVEFDAF